MSPIFAKNADRGLYACQYMNPFNDRLYVQQYTFVRTSSNRNGVRQGECQEKRFTSMRSYFVNVWDLSHVKAMATF